MKRAVLAGLFAAVILLFSCKEDYAAVAVAEYNGGNVTFSEIKERYERMSAEERSSINDREDYFKLVRQIALEEIILLHSAELKMDEESEFQTEIKALEQKVGYELLKKKNVLDKIAVVESDYKRYRTTYELYQIVKRTDILDENRIRQSKELLERLSGEIKSLDDFMKAALKHSDDVTKADGGFVGKIRLGVMDDEIDEVLQKLVPGKVSTIVETYAGYHLLFVNSKEEAPMDELLKDKKLYEMLYREKSKSHEESWYKRLMAEKELKIYEEKLAVHNYDSEVVVEYRGRTITREAIFTKVDELRQDGAFPEPTKEELLGLVKNMALTIVLEEQIGGEEVTGRKEFKEKISAERRYKLINKYIDRFLEIPPVTETDIREFYDANLTTLFTFKDEKGNSVIQDIAEVEKFISQKVERTHRKEARYTLYRKLIDDNGFKVYDKYLDHFIAEQNR